MQLDFFIQLLFGTLTTIKLAVCAVLFGLCVGMIGAALESISNIWLRYIAAGFIFLIRGLPELLVLFFIYFGLAITLSHLFHHYVDVNPFLAGVIALGLIFGAYASQVFRGAFLAIDKGQLEAARALGFNSLQIMLHVQIPQAWRHALPGLGNLWLVLLKDTAIVMLIGLTDIMGQAKIAASSTQQPFTFYLLAAFIYLVITSISEQGLNYFTQRANKYLHI